MFKESGDFEVTIKEVVISEPKFASPPAFDICLLVEAADGQSDWWRGEFSTNYGKGNFANKTQMQITLETLTRVGLPNGDPSKLQSLVGVKTTAWVKETDKDGKKYYNVASLASSYKPTALANDEISNRFKALMTPGATFQQQQPAQTAPAAAAATFFGTPATASSANPFGK